MCEIPRRLPKFNQARKSLNWVLETETLPIPSDDFNKNHIWYKPVIATPLGTFKACGPIPIPTSPNIPYMSLDDVLEPTVVVGRNIEKYYVPTILTD